MIASSTTAIARAAVDKSDATGVAIRWFLGGLLAIAFGVALALFSPRFGYAYEVGAMPVLWLAAGLVLAGRLLSLLAAAHRDSLSCDPREGAADRGGHGCGRTCRGSCCSRANRSWKTTISVISGRRRDAQAAAILCAVAEEARGKGALRRPARAAKSCAASTIQAATVYPPVTQTAFALAHLIEPWS
jgi:hypothetical protein